VVGADPRVTGEPGDVHGSGGGQEVPDGQQDAQGVVEERDERDLRWRGNGGEVVLAHDGDVDLGGAQGAQGRAAVQQMEASGHLAGVTLLSERSAVFAVFFVAGAS
jgi:hypothetical protein